MTWFSDMAIWRLSDASWTGIYFPISMSLLLLLLYPLFTLLNVRGDDPRRQQEVTLTAEFLVFFPYTCSCNRLSGAPPCKTWHLTPFGNSASHKPQATTTTTKISRENSHVSVHPVRRTTPNPRQLFWLHPPNLSYIPTLLTHPRSAASQLLISQMNIPLCLAPIIPTCIS